MKVLIDQNIPKINGLILNELELIEFSGRNITNQDIKNSKAEVLIIRSTTIVNIKLLKNTNIKFIASATSGSDHINFDDLKMLNINVFIAKGCNANSVAEYVIFSILHWSKNLNINLNAKSIGIIGFGNVGTKVAKYTHHLGLTVFINDPPLFKTRCVYDYKYLHLNEMISNVDILTIHTPLKLDSEFQTKNLLNENNLHKFNKNGLLINTARGGVIDESFLLNNNFYKIIDVWENEPNYDTKLAEYSFISTPHIAGYSRNGKLNGTFMCFDAINRYFKSINLKNNFDFSNFNELPPLNDITKFNNNEIYNKLKSNRNIYTDSKFFKSKNIDFDSQRKDYPIRYESFY